MSHQQLLSPWTFHGGKMSVKPAKLCFCLMVAGVEIERGREGGRKGGRAAAAACRLVSVWRGMMGNGMEWDE